MLSSFSARFAFGASSPVGGGGITPDQLPNLLAWYKADSLVGYNNGDPVALLPDSSGNSLDLDQLIGFGPSPTYIAADANFNNKPSINFTGGRGLVRYLSYGQFPTGANPFTMYMVGYSSRTYFDFAIDFMFGWGQNSDARRVAFVNAYYVAGGGGYYVDCCNTGAGGSYTSPGSVPYIFSYSYNGGDLASPPNIFYQNDVPHATGVSGFNLNLNNMQVTMGCMPDFGGGFSMWGRITEAIVYTQYHDLTTKQQIWNYFNQKYSVY
jgi:hypothetical protein